MIEEYTNDYIEYAMDTLGSSLDYAVNNLKIEGDMFLNLFISSGIAKEFEEGNPKYIFGMSGRELAKEILNTTNVEYMDNYKERLQDYSKEYWCGWILTYYQWTSGISFKKILSVLNYDMILNSFDALHEGGNQKAVETFDSFIHKNSFLSIMRKNNNMTQKELAEKSNVSIRSIQLYEQKVNDINKAQYNNLKDIACALHCNIEDILE